MAERIWDKLRLCAHEEKYDISQELYELCFEAAEIIERSWHLPLERSERA